MIGIYKITNTIDNKSYIGKSIDTKTRFRKHRNRLRKDIHHNQHLQRSWNKYGEVFFTFEVVEECEKENLDWLEMFYIQKFNTYEDGYNMNYGGEKGIGYKHSKKEKESMKIRNIGNNNPYSKKVLCDGHIYNTIRDCAEHYSIGEKTMQKWLSGYRSMRQDFKAIGLSYYN